MSRAAWATAAGLSLLLSLPVPVRAAEKRSGLERGVQISAPIALVSNLANQVELFDREPSTIGATLLTAGSTHEVRPVACEMTDEHGNIVGVTTVPYGIWGAGGYGTDYQVIVEIHPLNGSFTFDYVLDDAPPRGSLHRGTVRRLRDHLDQLPRAAYRAHYREAV